ncbi:MAG: tetratricopeptide repeat protein [Bacteroidales bacterium]|nr:tetratricopeptide repeat protein [Bacteroidales bacterium]MCF8344193.1 tetratricopeptide repeat protein [Bacteroidales bacterium]MCF8352268.1 tetratricopeptide repeat protein [Bacteroidales bacterium]MCF8375488.1 tetratricopeptide repeat protein [Bacteroidales bacterium]MCF8399887.1 tetratricopeptide repeat protein [Bacteroidales bacterium]
MKKTIIIGLGFLLSLPLFLKAQDGASCRELLEKGSSYYQNRSIDSAIYCYNLAVENHPECEEAWFRRALAKEKMHDIDGAIEDYYVAISITPKPIYYNNIGIDLAVKGEYEEAIEIYDKALEMDSLYTQAIFNKGIAFHYLGRWNEACELAGKAREMGLEIAGQYISDFCE